MSDANSTNLPIIIITKITVQTKANITIGKQRSTRQEKLNPAHQLITKITVQTKANITIAKQRSTLKKN
jgi:hypothetical protein